ncbi:MAG: hypothetical protein WCD21_01170 [Streptomyces sp.]
MRRDPLSSRKCTAAVVRKSAPTFARALAERLTTDGHSVTVVHRDLSKAVVQR